MIVAVTFTDGMTCQFKASGNIRPHLTDGRFHIEISPDEYTVIPVSMIKMYTVTTESKK